jgi:hypothetical protein
MPCQQSNRTYSLLSSEIVEEDWQVLRKLPSSSSSGGGVMRDVEARKRVERMLHGTFTTNDFSTVVLSLREREYGKDSVKEIGHFFAHPHERDKGLVTETARDFFAAVRLYLFARENKLDLNNAPPFLPGAVRGIFNLLGQEELRKGTGLNRKQLKRVLSSALSKLHPARRGTYSPQESAVLKFLATKLVARAAFTDLEFLDDLWSVMLKNHLVRDSDRASFTKIQPAMTLCVISRMHGCKVKIDDGQVAELVATCNHDPDRNLAVMTRAASPTARVPDLRVATHVFSSTLRARDWCGEELLNDVEIGWHYPLEVSPSQKLSRLTLNLETPFPGV